MNVPPTLLSDAAVPQQPHPVSDAAKRRRLRAQLVQEHIAKITQQGLGSSSEEARDQEVEDFPDNTRREVVVEARGGRICTIVFDTPCGHSAGRLKLVTGFERLDVEEDEDPQKWEESKRPETLDELEQKASKHRQSTRTPMEATNIDKSPEDLKKAHSAGIKHVRQRLKKEFEGAMAHQPALRGPPLHQTQKQDKVPQNRLKKVGKPKGGSAPQKASI